MLMYRSWHTKLTLYGIKFLVEFNSVHFKTNMGTKTFKKIDKKGHEEEWSWEETPEVVAAIRGTT